MIVSSSRRRSDADQGVLLIARACQLFVPMRRTGADTGIGKRVTFVLPTSGNYSARLCVFRRF
jgi:hypothetical protein